jgi:hypothetical protein
VGSRVVHFSCVRDVSYGRFEKGQRLGKSCECGGKLAENGGWLWGEKDEEQKLKRGSS